MSPLVNYGGNGIQIDPASGFDGILNIDFADAVSAVGFGTVELGVLESITVYDVTDAIIGMFSGVSDSTFDYFGLLALDGDLIGRIELDGNFFAIQNIQFNIAQVPEPATLFLLLAAFAAMAIGRRRRDPAPVTAA